MYAIQSGYVVASACRRAMISLVSRVVILGVLAASLALAEPAAWAQDAQEPDQLETLKLSSARYYMSKALGREFGVQYRYRVGGKIKCRRASDTRARCSVNWGIGDSGFSGVGYIWYDIKEGDLWWNYSWRIVRTDYYCANVLKKPLYKCTRRYVIR